MHTRRMVWVLGLAATVACADRSTGSEEEDTTCDPSGGNDCDASTDTNESGEGSTGDVLDPDPDPDGDGLIDCADLAAGGQTVGGSELGPLGFPEVACMPSSSAMGSYRCCSDDPAAVDGGLPDYEGKNIVGGTTPIFSGANNGLGTSGLCVDTSQIPSGAGLLEAAAANCPIPCNPTWDTQSISAVCGPTRACCQTRELQPEDCVFDQVQELWRPATGADIGTSTVTPATTWTPDRHRTHQDPNGAGCLTFTGGSMGADFTDCVQQLSVADQRGYCMALSPGQACPHADPTYLDACEQINMGLIPPPGG